MTDLQTKDVALMLDRPDPDFAEGIVIPASGSFVTLDLQLYLRSTRDKSTRVRRPVSHRKNLLWCNDLRPALE
ncbi:hypothetical protein D3C76_1747600 [compost metagenome]